MSDLIKVPTCKHYDMTVAELEADGYAMEDMPLCEMCSYDEIERLQAENKDLAAKEEYALSKLEETLKIEINLRKEIERLKAELDSKHEWCVNTDLENARLREALKKRQFIINRSAELLQRGHRDEVELYLTEASEEALKQ